MVVIRRVSTHICQLFRSVRKPRSSPMRDIMVVHEVRRETHLFGGSEAQAQQVMRIVVVVLVGTKLIFLKIKSFEAWWGSTPASISFTLFTGTSRNTYPLAAVQVVFRQLFRYSFQLWQQILQKLSIETFQLIVKVNFKTIYITVLLNNIFWNEDLNVLLTPWKSVHMPTL